MSADLLVVPGRELLQRLLRLQQLLAARVDVDADVGDRAVRERLGGLRAGAEVPHRAEHRRRRGAQPDDRAAGDHRLAAVPRATARRRRERLPGALLEVLRRLGVEVRPAGRWAGRSAGPLGHGGRSAVRWEGGRWTSGPLVVVAGSVARFDGRLPRLVPRQPSRIAGLARLESGRRRRAGSSAPSARSARRAARPGRGCCRPRGTAGRAARCRPRRSSRAPRGPAGSSCRPTAEHQPGGERAAGDHRPQGDQRRPAAEQRRQRADHQPAGGREDDVPGGAVEDVAQARLVGEPVVADTVPVGWCHTLEPQPAAPGARRRRTATRTATTSSGVRQQPPERASASSPASVTTSGIRARAAA